MKFWDLRVLYSKKSFSIVILILIIINFIHTSEEILSISQIVEQYGKAIVLIATVKGEEETVGIGSGFIIDSKGIIITNYHVIAGAYPAVIKLTNGDIYDDISIIETDARRDVAIIKIGGFNLPMVKLGNSDSIKVGEQVVVIGNPKGLENTVTDGLISGIRDIREGYKLHQISAPVSSGSSGSPVFNIRGEVVGITTSSIVEGQNLNFSVPINYARGMISEEVKMSLEEFSKGPTKDSPFQIRDLGDKNLKETLIKFNEAIIKFYQAYDNFLYGISETTEPHIGKFYPRKFFISPSLYVAKEIASNVHEEIMRLRSNDKELSSIRDEIIRSTNKAKEGIDIAIQGLKKYPYLSSYPDWNAVMEGSVKVISASDIMAKQVNKKFLNKIIEYSPELKDEVLPIILLSEEPQTGKKAYLGILWSLSIKDVTIISVVSGTAADRVGLKRGDVILGAWTGENFPTIIELDHYLNKFKPGDLIILEIDRKGVKEHFPVRLGRR